MVTVIAVAGGSRGDQKVWYAYGSIWKFPLQSGSMVTITAVAGSSRDGQEVWLRLWQ